MTRPAAVVAAIVGVVLVALIVLFATSPDGTVEAGSRRLVGEVAPVLAGPTVDGGSFDLDEQRGSWVVVNFFSTNCGPCIVEHPQLVAFEERHAAVGDASIVSVAFGDPPETVQAFFDDNGGEWPVLADEDGSFAFDYEVVAVPESLVIDPAGVVAEKLIGGVTVADLEAVMARGPVAADAP